MYRHGELKLVQVLLQQAGPDERLRMYGLDEFGRLWSRAKGTAGWGEWRREYNPLSIDSGQQ